MKSTEKLKKRYISFTIKSQENLSQNDVKSGLYINALRFFGELGFSEIAFKLMVYDEKEKRGIIRCWRNAKEKVRGFLALINELNGKKARVISQKTSGMVNKVIEAAPPRHDTYYSLDLP